MRQVALVLSVVATLFFYTGCASSYSVKLDGDVQGTDRDTPRAVKCDVHFGTEARSCREAGGRHLHALPDATVTVQLKFKEKLAKSSQTVKVDSRTAQFHYEAAGESNDGALTGVLISVKCPGRQNVERLLAAAPDVPFEEIVMAVLDEAGPGAATGDPAPVTSPAPTPSPDAAKAANGGK